MPLRIVPLVNFGVDGHMGTGCKLPKHRTSSCVLEPAKEQRPALFRLAYPNQEPGGFGEDLNLPPKVDDHGRKLLTLGARLRQIGWVAIKRLITAVQKTAPGDITMVMVERPNASMIPFFFDPGDVPASLEKMRRDYLVDDLDRIYVRLSGDASRPKGFVKRNSCRFNSKQA